MGRGGMRIVGVTVYWEECGDGEKKDRCDRGGYRRYARMLYKAEMEMGVGGGSGDGEER